jgi:hypothetical protein
MASHDGAARETFDDLAEEMAADGVSTGSMFGHPSLTHGRKAIGCLDGDDMVFRLGAGSAAHTEASAVPGAHPFDPSGAGRAMKDWVVVPASSAARWKDWARAAIDALGT